MLVRLAIDGIFSEALLWQHVNLDAKPNIPQQQQKCALIHYATAGFDLDLLPSPTLASTVGGPTYSSAEIPESRRRNPQRPERSTSRPSRTSTSTAMKSRICWWMCCCTVLRRSIPAQISLNTLFQGRPICACR